MTEREQHLAKIKEAMRKIKALRPYADDDAFNEYAVEQLEIVKANDPIMAKITATAMTAKEFEAEFWTDQDPQDRHAFAEAYASHITKELRAELRLWKKDDQGCD